MASKDRPTARSAAKRDAIAMLIDDHKRVKSLFDEFKRFEAQGHTDAGFDAFKQELMDAVCAELKVHTRIEEEIFYAAARMALADGDDLLNEAEVEHATAKHLIAEIENSDASDAMTCARFKVLGEYINHHVKEEETEMFPLIRQSGIDLQALALKMARRKEELVFELAEQQFNEPAPVSAAPGFWARIRAMTGVPALH